MTLHPYRSPVAIIDRWSTHTIRTKSGSVAALLLNRQTGRADRPATTKLYVCKWKPPATVVADRLYQTAYEASIYRYRWIVPTWRLALDRVGGCHEFGTKVRDNSGRVWITYLPRNALRADRERPPQSCGDQGRRADRQSRVTHSAARSARHSVYDSVRLTYIKPSVRQCCPCGDISVSDRCLSIARYRCGTHTLVAAQSPLPTHQCHSIDSTRQKHATDRIE